MRNEYFLQKTIEGEQIDYLYHLGLSNQSEELTFMVNIKNVVMAGSGDRIDRMARTYEASIELCDSFMFEKNERFEAYYVHDTLFISHGMGMASASICLQEVLKLLYYIAHGDMNRVNDIFICRVGTSGGFGVEPGTIVVTEHAYMTDLSPYKLKNSEITFDPTYPNQVVRAIIKANPNTNITSGVTLSGDDFYVEQLREDGAIIEGGIAITKDAMFSVYETANVKNMEMEAAMIAGVCNDFGHSNFATICATLVDRFKGDQVTSTPTELAEYSMNAEAAVFNYLKTRKES